MELDLQLELARIQSNERVRIAQIKLEHELELARIERIELARIELARIERIELARIELARIESHTKGWYCSICQDCSRFNKHVVNRLSLLVEEFADFDYLLEACSNCRFPPINRDYITHYISGRRDTLDFVVQPSDSDSRSELTTIVSEGGTRLPKIRATDFDVRTVNISLIAVELDFQKLAGFHTTRWFGEDKCRYEKFVESQVSFLNTIRSALFGTCETRSFPEKLFQGMVHLFCIQFISALCQDGSMEVINARHHALTCEILANQVKSCLVGYSDIFLTSSPYNGTSSLYAALELKAPTILRGADWFRVRCQVIAQLLMLQAMNASEEKTEALDDAKTDVGEVCKARLSMVKAGVFDGFCMEIFCLLDGPLEAQLPNISESHVAGEESLQPTCFLSQRVAEADQCISMLLFLLCDISYDVLVTVSNKRIPIVIDPGSEDKLINEHNEISDDAGRSTMRHVYPTRSNERTQNGNFIEFALFIY
jgi:hypothetical protein